MRACFILEMPKAASSLWRHDLVVHDGGLFQGNGNIDVARVSGDLSLYVDHCQALAEQAHLDYTGVN
jgi:hypothetical protein